MFKYSLKRSRRRSLSYIIQLLIVGLVLTALGIKTIIKGGNIAGGIALIIVGLCLTAGMILVIKNWGKKEQVLQNAAQGTDPVSAESCIKQIRENPILYNFFSMKCGLSFLSAADCSASLKRIIGNCMYEKNYLPFAADSKGGMLSVLDDRHIIYISADGEYKIVGNNFRDYLEAAMLCRFPYDLSGRFETKYDLLYYVEKLEPLDNETAKELEKFRYLNRMTRTPEELYDEVLFVSELDTGY